MMILEVSCWKVGQVWETMKASCHSGWDTYIRLHIPHVYIHIGHCSQGTEYHISWDEFEAEVLPGLSQTDLVVLVMSEGASSVWSHDVQVWCISELLWYCIDNLKLPQVTAIRQKVLAQCRRLGSVTVCSNYEVSLIQYLQVYWYLSTHFSPEYNVLFLSKTLTAVVTRQWAYLSHLLLYSVSFSQPYHTCRHRSCWSCTVRLLSSGHWMQSLLEPMC